MQIAGCTALVTGANRGIGRHFAAQLLDRGASRVFATARDSQSIDLHGVVALPLDITDPRAVANAAHVAGDVDVLINNAGTDTRSDLVSGDPELLRAELETNLFGTLAMVRAFAPILARNAGGAILNVLSVLSWRASLGSGAYSVAKAAAWSMTNGVRLELAGQGTLVTGLHLGATDTDMMGDWDGPRNDPADVARLALDGIEEGRLEVLADEVSRRAKADLAEDPSRIYPELATFPAFD